MPKIRLLTFFIFFFLASLGILLIFKLRQPSLTKRTEARKTGEVQTKLKGQEAVKSTPEPDGFIFSIDNNTLVARATILNIDKGQETLKVHFSENCVSDDLAKLVQVKGNSGTICGEATFRVALVELRKKSVDQEKDPNFYITAALVDLVPQDKVSIHASLAEFQNVINSKVGQAIKVVGIQ